MILQKNIRLISYCTLFLLYLVFLSPVYAFENSISRGSADNMLSPQIQISHKAVRSEIIDMVAFAKSNNVFNKFTPILFWQVKILKKFGMQSEQSRTASLIRKINKAYAIKGNVGGRKRKHMDLTYSDFNWIFSQALLNDQVTNEKLEAIINLGLNIKHNWNCLRYNVQLCDAFDPGPSTFAISDTRELLLACVKFASDFSDEDFFAVMNFFETVVSEGYEMHYALSMAKEIDAQKGLNSAGFSAYAVEVSKVLKIMKDEQYNRETIEVRSIVSSLIEAVSKGRTLRIVESKKIPKRSFLSSEINMLDTSSFYRQGISIESVDTSLVEYAI
ncbi:MAG: hypothetical protein GY853_00210 [PVC group bacterium]|nr:hypothetical protein [PVC group bacterium]